LGKEMVKNVIILRFANIFYRNIWNRHSIANVQITFKEKIGVEGRGGYFDSYGIIRDVMQNHLLQILTLIAMEEPYSLTSEAIRDEKVRVLAQIAPIDAEEHVILGQYERSEFGEGYLEDKSVPKQSKTATFAATLLHINNDRWRGVPFIMKCGKALDDQKTEVRIQFKDVPQHLFKDTHSFFTPESHPTTPIKEKRPHVLSPTLSRNELVIRVSPKEAVYMKFIVKKPGLGFDTTLTALDLTYTERFDGVRIPDAYESLLLDALLGDHSNFVRSDELEAAWKLFTPLLHFIDAGKLPIYQYPRGSRGPSQVDALIEKDLGYRRTEQLLWKE
jgi:glucose-6-phosphate 1-dehydrogenase